MTTPSAPPDGAARAAACRTTAAARGDSSDSTAATGADPTVKRFLPWIVAAALFMVQLDSTILSTAVPSIASSLQVEPLSLKAVITCYVLSLAVCIPVSGWMADRFGVRRVFAGSVALFTVASMLCGVSSSLTMMIGARVLQGAAAGMMMPIGRLLVVRTFAKSELLAAMNFVIIPALLGPLIGPIIGGAIVHWLSWRTIFFVNVPVGLAVLWLIFRHLPGDRSTARRPLDWVGLMLFSAGTTLLSWLLGVFGDHRFGTGSPAVALLAISLLVGYGWHARCTPHPLLNLALFRVRTFRVSVLGGFVTRLGLGAMPFLLPLLYQIGLGLPAWQSGLLMVPMAAAAMAMKAIAPRLLARHGYRNVLVVNTLLIGSTIAVYSLIADGTPLAVVVLLGLALGFFNSLQFSSVNSMAYADIEAPMASMASTMASTVQQLSMSFGLAMGSLLTGWYLGDLPQTDRLAITGSLQQAFLTLGVLTLVSSLSFWSLRPADGEAVSRGRVRDA